MIPLDENEYQGSTMHFLSRSPSSCSWVFQHLGSASWQKPQKKEEHYRKSRKVIPHTNLYPCFQKTHVHLCTDFATTMLVQIRIDRCIELIERSFSYVTCRSSLVTQAMYASKWWAWIRSIADIRANNTSVIAELWLSLKTPQVMSQVLGLKDKLLLCRVTKAIMLQQVVAVGIITKAVNCPVQLLCY